MLQRHSPAVSYPLQLSGWLKGVWSLWALGSALALLLWWWQGAGYGYRQVWVICVSALVYLIACAVSWHAVRRCPQGMLHSTGSGWEWKIGAGQSLSLKNSPLVILDMQSLLVIAFQVDANASTFTQRFVLQRNWAPDAWVDLRRAVYSSNDSTHDAAENLQP